MKKTLLAMMVMAISIISNGQTQINGPSSVDLELYVICSEFTSDNKAQLVAPENGVLKFYDNNMTIVHQMVQPLWDLADLTVWNFDVLEGINHDNSVGAITQTLFNNDNSYEFFVRDCGQVVDDYGCERTVTRGLMVMKEDGSTIWSWRATEGNSGKTFLVKWGGKYFIVTEEYEDGNDEWTWYLIDRPTQNIKQVEGPTLTVRPTVADKGQVITVVLGNENNASEIQIVNGLGQTVKRIPVTEGQKEVKIHTDDLGKGMHIIGAQSQQNIGTCKIIVK